MQQLGNDTAAALQMKAGRQRLTRAGTFFPPIHVGTWGPAKTRKTSLGLRAKTSEVRTSSVYEPVNPLNPFEVRKVISQGQVLIPSRPLRIALANFDRKADTVLKDIEHDFDIIEESLYELPDGAPASLANAAEYQAMIDRFLEFIADVRGDVDLIVCDGGTILWENVRGVLLESQAPAGKTPEGDARHLPRQYAPANKYMRESIMKTLYNLPLHTLITREAGERWSGQNSPDLDQNEPGGVALRPDGWNKTGHYIDVDLQMRLIKNPGQEEQVTGICHMSILPGMIGQSIRNPTFSGVYSTTMRLPLLLPEDRALFDELKTKHEKLEWD